MILIKIKSIVPLCNNRNGTSTGENCYGKDTASCCKVGNGNVESDFACFYTAEDDPTMPENIANLDACVCALLSVNINNDGDLSMLGPNCKSRMPSAGPSQSIWPSLSPSLSSAPSESIWPSLSPSVSSLPSKSPVVSGPTTGQDPDPTNPPTMSPTASPTLPCTYITTRQDCNKAPGCKWDRVHGCGVDL